MQEFLEIARNAALEAGHIQREAFRTAHRVEYKSPDDIVTDVDKRAETAIKARILETFPEHTILAEESGEQNESSYRWIVDPLDGTTNFVQGIAHYCVSIALEIDGRLELGVIYHTPEDDLYTAVRGDGAHLDDESLSVSTVEQLGHAVVAVEFSPDDLTTGDTIGILAAINRRARRTRHMGSSASELAMVAQGTFDGLFGTRFHPWDIAAGHVLVDEAGGEVTRLDGANRSGQYLISNGTIHSDLLGCIEEVTDGS